MREAPRYMVRELSQRGLLRVEDGNHGEYRPRKHEFVENGVAFVRAADLGDAGIDFASASRINEVARSRITKGIGQPKDIILSHKGTIGKVAKAPSDAPPFVCSPQTTFWRSLDRETLDQEFLYAFIRSPDFRAQLDSRAGETDMAGYVSLTAQRTFWVPLPPIEIQKETVSCLRLVDKKIELNRRMNETLEATARAIFKDWFVDFGPTRAKAEGRTPYLASELWDLFPDSLNDEDTPVGWATISLKQLGRVVTGKTPSTKNQALFGDDMPLMKIPDMRGRVYVLRTSTSLSEEGVKSQKQKTVPVGSVSVSCIATPGLVTFNHQDTQTNQQINTIIPADRKQSHFIFWSCRQLAAAVMRGGSGGSVFHNMNKSSFENLRIIYPGEEIARCYSKTVNHIHSHILLSEYESLALAQTRDLLLPKLMSGEIRLLDAEQVVGEVA